MSRYRSLSLSAPSARVLVTAYTQGGFVQKLLILTNVYLHLQNIISNISITSFQLRQWWPMMAMQRFEGDDSGGGEIQVGATCAAAVTRDHKARLRREGW